MSDLFASGHVIDAILVLVVLEAGLLIWWHGRTGRGVAPGEFLANLLSGVALMLAVRSALTGAWWGWTGAFLAVAFAAHLTDLGRRWHA